MSAPLFGLVVPADQIDSLKICQKILASCVGLHL